MRPYKVAYEHPTQLLASTFLRALAEDDGAVVWERLSRESRGLLEGRYAAAARIALHRAASIEAGDGDARLAEVVAPVRASALGVLGRPELLLSLGASAARLGRRGGAFFRFRGFQRELLDQGIGAGETGEGTDFIVSLR